MPEMRQGVTDIFVRQALDGAAYTQPGDDLAQMVAQSDGNTAVPGLKQIRKRQSLSSPSARKDHRFSSEL